MITKDTLSANFFSGKSNLDVLDLDKITKIANDFDIDNPYWVQLYSLINGGHPKKDYFQIDERRDFLVNNFFNLDTSRKNPENAFEIKYLLFSDKDYFPIARDGGGNILLIKTKSKDYGIYVWYNDTRSEPIQIAPNLEIFLESLEEFDDEEGI